jgi:hypothetical protein
MAILTFTLGVCSITRDNLGPYRQKVLYIPTVYLITTLVSQPLHFPTAVNLLTCLEDE